MATTYFTIDCDCKIERGLGSNCLNNTPGGNDITLYITNVCDIDFDTTTTDENVIDIIDLKDGASWYTIAANQDSVQTQVGITRGFANFTLTFKLDPLGDGLTTVASAASTIDFINELKNPRNKYVVVVQSNNDVRFVYGLNTRGVRFSADASAYDSGLAFTDENAWTIVLTGTDTRLPKVLNSSLVLTPVA